jgi:hypothetical protein
MATRTPYPGTESVGDSITKTNFDKLPGGLIGYATITSNSSNFTSEADISGLTVTMTWVAGRLYRFEAFGLVGSSVSGDEIKIFINVAGSDVTLADRSINDSTANESVYCAGILTGSGSTTVKVRGARAQGSGNCSIKASSTVPFWLFVYDVGPSF